MTDAVPGAAAEQLCGHTREEFGELLRVRSQLTWSATEPHEIRIHGRRPKPVLASLAACSKFLLAIKTEYLFHQSLLLTSNV